MSAIFQQGKIFCILTNHILIHSQAYNLFIPIDHCHGVLLSNGHLIIISFWLNQGTSCAVLSAVTVLLSSVLRAHLTFPAFFLASHFFVCRKCRGDEFRKSALAGVVCLFVTLLVFSGVVLKDSESKE